MQPGLTIANERQALKLGYCMRSTVTFAGVQKKGNAPRNIASRGNATMSSGGEERSRERRRAQGQQDRVVRHNSGPRQLITFVDSQDPNSRSTIQRHTAHHSNAQRREIRLQSLRNTSRPRVLRWTRRQSAEILPVTSPASSNSSSSISPLPPTQRPQAPADETTEPPPTTSETSAVEVSSRSSPDRESAIQYLMDHLCQHSQDHDMCEEIIAYARTDEACANLLLAYCISLRRNSGHSSSNEADADAARNYLNQGTSLLRARLSDPTTATADANIQAVLLLIAYTADFGSLDEVRIHSNALRTMIDQRGGVVDGNYPHIVAHQLNSIPVSRFLHLTLDCSEPCGTPSRFPHGLFSL